MLNENKVKMMTKMAIYEKNEGRTMLKTAKYFKSDYVTMGVLGMIVWSTIAFVVMIAMMALCNMQWITKNINDLSYYNVGSKFIIWYLIFVVFFSTIGGVVYAHRYDASRKEIKKYFSRLSKLEHYYGMKNKKANTRR